MTASCMNPRFPYIMHGCTFSMGFCGDPLLFRSDNDHVVEDTEVAEIRPAEQTSIVELV